MQNRRRSNNRRNSGRRYDSSRSEKTPNSNNILPAPGILESYEEISPGSVKLILEMAKSEQDHRHNWENRYLRAMAYTSRVGQLLGFALAIILVYTCMMLAYSDKEGVAAFIAFSGFAFLMMAALSSAKSRKHVVRPRRNFEPK